MRGLRGEQLMITKRALIFSSCVAILLFAGCSGKANLLKIAATQYEADSLAAIDSIENLTRQEYAPPERSAAEASREFADLIIGYDADKEITQEAVQLAIAPDVVNLPSDVASRRTKFFADLRTQYRNFVAIFDDIESGSFFARDDVVNAKPYVEMLTAQLAYFARTLSVQPPQLLQRRNVLLNELEAIRKNNGNASEKRQDILRWRDQWNGLIDEENRLTRITVEQCLKAATVGMEIRKQLVAYNRLSMQDITEALSRGIELGGALTGKDLTTLQVRTSEIIAAIESDPNWKAAAERALSAINDAYSGT